MAKLPASPPEPLPTSTQAPPAGEETLPWLEELPPKKIVAELDRYIVGQAAAKKAVAIAIRNRWRRAQAPDEIRDEIVPNNIIMIGPTGVGKTEIARRLARLAGAPFVKVEASKFTEVGYVGRDVESMVRDLVDVAINMVRAEREDDVADVAEARVEERLLDLLLPASAESDGDAEDKVEGKPPEDRKLFVAGPGGVEASDLPGRRARTREKLKALLRDGKLEDREVEVEVSQTPSLEGMMVPMGGGDGMDYNFTE